MIVALLVACLALTVLKFAAFALVIVLIVSVLWGAFAHPAETLGVLIFFVFASAMASHAVACLTFLGLLTVCLALRPIQPRQPKSEDQSQARRNADPDGPGQAP